MKTYFNQRPCYSPKEFNTTKGEKLAIKQFFALQQLGNIIIRLGDKGGAVVIMDRDQYLAEGYKQLSDTSFYQKLDHNPTEKHRREINDFIDQMLQNGEIDLS